MRLARLPNTTDLPSLVSTAVRSNDVHPPARSRSISDFHRNYGFVRKIRLGACSLFRRVDREITLKCFWTIFRALDIFFFLVY